MTNYIDAFVFPIRSEHLDEYKAVANQVADIYKEYGAIAYNEFAGDDLTHEGLLSFVDSVNAEEGETVIFGWAAYESKEARDRINELVRKDPRMDPLVNPIMNPERMVFNPGRMQFGGFKTLVQK